MKYIQVQQLRKQASEVNTLLDNSLKKHYASLLAQAYKASTGEVLKNPEQHIDPRFSYTIGRAPNVRPEILAKLKDFYKTHFSRIATTSYNMSPAVAMKAVEAANENPYVYPLGYRALGLDPNAKYETGVKIKAELVDR